MDIEYCREVLNKIGFYVSDVVPENDNNFGYFTISDTGRIFLIYYNSLTRRLFTKDYPIYSDHEIFEIAKRINLSMVRKYKLQKINESVSMYKNTTL